MDDDMICHLLLTLPPKYDGVITAIETLTDERVSIHLIKNPLLEYETNLQVLNPLEMQLPAQALSAKSLTGKNSFNNKKNKKRWKPNKNIFKLYKSHPN